MQLGNIGALLTAALSGAAMAAQGTMNSVLGKTVGLWQATLVVHILGTALSALAVFTIGKSDLLLKIGSANPISWFGGVLGVLIVFGVATSMSQVGVSPATTAIISAQLLAAFLIDQLNFLGVKQIPFHPIKLAGALMIIVGAWIILKK